MKSLNIVLLIVGLWVRGTADTLTVREDTAWEKIPLAGTVEAEQDRVLVTNRMAEVVALPVQQGQKVGPDSVLIRLQDKALQQQLEALKQAQRARESAVRQAQLQLDRLTRLAEKGAVAQVQKEAAELELKAAEAGLGEVLAQQKQVEEMQTYLVIKTGVAGQLTELNVSLGDTAMPGQPLGRFVTHGVRTLKVNLPDHLAGHVAEAQWEVKAAASDTWVKTNLVAVSDTPEPGTAQYKTYLEAPDFLIPNQRVDVRILLPLRGIFIPGEAIEQRGNLSYVRIQQENGVSRRLVKLGLPLADGRCQVFGGLQVGEQIVIGEVGHE